MVQRETYPENAASANTMSTIFLIISVQTGNAPKPNEEHLHLYNILIKFSDFKYERKADCKITILYCGLLICWYLILSTFVCAYDVKWISSIYVF